MLNDIVIKRLLAIIDRMVADNKAEAVHIKSDPTLYRVGVTDGRHDALESLKTVVSTILDEDPDSPNKEF